MRNRLLIEVLLTMIVAAGLHGQGADVADSVVSYKRLPPGVSSRTTNVPLIRIDGFQVVDDSRIDKAPQPVGGIDAIQQAVTYPDLARRAGLRGRVLVNCSIDSLGRPTNVQVISSDAPIFSDSVVAGISRTKFNPALWNGRPTHAHMSISVRFSIRRLIELMKALPISVSEISLRGSPGMFGGPQFMLILHKDGSAIYEGQADVDMLGTFEGRCDPLDFRRLTVLLREFCFFDSTYVRPSRVVDIPWMLIGATNNGQVVDRSSGDDDCMWALAVAIQQVCRQIGWVRVH